MHISADAHTHIQAHSLMMALTLSCACTRARTRMHMHTMHTGVRAQTRMRTRIHATHMHAVTCKHAPAQCTCIHTHAAHASMHPHNAHACVCTRTREHACTCARTRANTRPHILTARYQIGVILLSSELCLERPYLSLAVWPCLYCTRMATPPVATLVVEADWPRCSVSVGMVAQLEASCWACHAMHKVVAPASSFWQSLAGWRISAV